MGIDLDKCKTIKASDCVAEGAWILFEHFTRSSQAIGVPIHRNYIASYLVRRKSEERVRTEVSEVQKVRQKIRTGKAGRVSHFRWTLRA
jgi:hypothetical protein